MNVFTALLLASAVVATFAAPSVSDREIDFHWESYKAHFPKFFHKIEDALRKANFIKTHQMIVDHKNGGHNYTMAHNHFSDMSQEEKEALLGFKAPEGSADPEWTPSDAAEVRYLPASVDYRTSSCLSAVKNQGGCGSCWTFASIAPLEFSACAKYNRQFLLSEQQLVDCEPQYRGCDGGWYWSAWDYLKGGSEYDYYYPYTGNYGTCRFDRNAIGAYVGSHGMVAKNANAMMTALQNGPLAVAFRAVDAIFSYSGGVYYDYGCAGASNHAVTVVGYGNLGGIDHWIVRNSWGASWGTGGYFLIQRGVNMCNIEAWPAYVNVL